MDVDDSIAVSGGQGAPVWDAGESIQGGNGLYLLESKVLKGLLIEFHL